MRHLPIIWIPYSNACIKTSRCYSRTIKSNGINLREMARQRAETSAFRDAPNSGSCVVTSGYHNIAFDFQTPDARLVTHENVLAETGLYVPNSQGCIS